MREILFASDGWGGQYVNQDTTWDIPSTPEPANKDPNSQPLWKPVINNGTDLWETNLRNGGQPPIQSMQKPSWGHTPSSNLGGTWGEDDDGTEGSSVWTGSANNPVGSVGVNANSGSAIGQGVCPSSAAQWGPSVGMGSVSIAGANVHPAVVVGGPSAVASGGLTGNATVNNSNVVNPGSGWGEIREIRSTNQLVGSAVDMRSIDPRTATPSEAREMRLLDPREPIRGDPRGISGRLNGTSEMWNHHQQTTHNPIPSVNKMVGQSVGVGNSNTSVNVSMTGISTGALSSAPSAAIGTQWGAQSAALGSKDIPKQVSGWEEPSPPSQRRNLPNYDDGTSLWSQQNRLPQSGSGHWKDMPEPIGRSHIMRPQSGNNTLPTSNIMANCNMQVGTSQNQISSSGVTQTRIISGIATGVVGAQLKQDSGLWIHPSVNNRNTNATWGDDNHGVGGSTVPVVNWSDEKSNATLAQASGASWADPAVGWINKQGKLSSLGATGGWSSVNDSCSNDGSDSRPDWASHVTGITGKSQPAKISAINVNVGGIGVNSDLLKQSKQYRLLVDNGHKKEDVERALINSNMNLDEAVEYLRNSGPATLENWRRQEESTLGPYNDHGSSSISSNFPGRFSSGSASLAFPAVNALNSGNGTHNTSVSALQTQKYLNQAHNSTIGGGVQGGNSAPIAFNQTLANSNSTINMSSNSNIQPSAHQLKMLVHQIHLAVQGRYLSSEILNQPLSPTTLVLLNQLLTYIKHLQAAQQQSVGRGGNQATRSTIARYEQEIRNLQNQINTQQAIYIKQQQSQGVQKSQHHSGSHMSAANCDFMRSHDSMNALHNNFSDMSLSKQSVGYQGVSNQQSRLNQWKLPSIEKDPMVDNIDFSRAPGSIKHSLSVTSSNNMGSLGLQTEGTWSSGRNLNDGWPETSTDNENKDWSATQNTSATYTDLVQEFEPGKPWKGSHIKSIEDDPNITPGSVARSPLSINAASKDSDIFASTSKNSPNDSASIGISTTTWSFNPSQNFQSWAESSQQNISSELWSTSINKTSRGPPPGLSSNKGRGTSTSGQQWPATNSSWGSSWLLLKNLTSQIEVSTLRTLCVQHGPLQNFHLYLNQGLALCKYATREEANKAQVKLNNCQIQNTTICAESPSDAEVQTILQSLPPSTSTTGATHSVLCNTTTSSISGGGNSTGKGIHACSNNPTTNPSGTGSNTIAQASVSSGISGIPQNNSTWRQQAAQSQAQQQNQNRPLAARENDFDYISQYVCSIVDD